MPNVYVYVHSQKDSIGKIFDIYLDDNKKKKKQKLILNAFPNVIFYAIA